MARVRRIVFAATIYLLWQERNGRIFNNRVNDPRVILKKIEGAVCEATWNWKFKRSYEN